MATEQVVSKSDLDAIERAYTIPSPDEVRELLARADVMPALLAAPAHIREAFGGRLRGIVLEAVHDPEEGEDLLSVTALVKATPREALELRSAVDEWWAARSLQVRLTVAFGVAPV